MESVVSRRFVHLSASCGSSLVVHLAIVLLLGLLMVPTTVKRLHGCPEVVLRPVPRDTVVERLKNVVTSNKPAVFYDSPPDRPQGYGRVSEGIRESILAPHQGRRDAYRQLAMHLDPGVINVLRSQPAELIAATSGLGEPLAVATSVDDALNQLTRELMNAGAGKDLQVIWMLDRSESMQDDRDEVVDYIETVHRELGLFDIGKSMQSAVVGFGADARLLTAGWTKRLDEVVDAMQNVTVDPSGLEMMCDAIQKTLSLLGGAVRN